MQRGSESVIRDAQWLEDRDLIKRTFRERFGRELDLDNPRTFNEKIAFKILFDRRPLLTLVTDKIRVRDYVAQKIGPAYIARLYQVCSSPRQIDWQALPPSFVVKPNHGSDMVEFIRDKSELKPEQLLPALERWLRVDYYRRHRREWSYRNIVPSLLFEEFLADEGGHIPPDFKFFVFDGWAAFVQVDFSRHTDHRRNFYDRDLNRLEVRLLYPTSDDRFVFPDNIEEMFALAGRLGSGFDFVRVDLYNVEGRIVFGEMTNYPEEGRGVFDPPEYDAIFGVRWQLPASYG